MDGNARRSLPRAPRVLQAQKPGLWLAGATKILLPLHLRVLLLALRHCARTPRRPVPVALHRLARLPHRLVRFDMDRQHLHGRLQLPTSRHQTRERKHRRRANRTPSRLPSETEVAPTHHADQQNAPRLNIRHGAFATHNQQRSTQAAVQPTPLPPFPLAHASL